MIEGQEGVTWPQWVALAHAAEEAQLDALFRSDHYRVDRPRRPERRARRLGHDLRPRGA